MTLNKKIAVLSLFLMSHVAHADSIDLQLGDQSVRVLYAAEVFGNQFGPTDFEVGALFNEDDTVSHAGLVLMSDSIDNPFVAAIGSRLYYGDVGNETGQTQADVAAITFGGSLSFRPEGLRGVGFNAYYYISPSVTSFLDADGFSELNVTADINVTEQVSFYLGYREITADHDTGVEIDVDSSFIYGFIFRF